MLTNPRTLHHLDGKYRVLAQLGRGGTADVFLAVARGPSGFSKLVVLKAMRTSLRYEREFTEMFLNEARLAARLNHPNVVQTNEVLEFEGLPVIVMEYLEGQPLWQIVARASAEKSFPSRLHLHVVSEALAGLHYSHGLTDFDGSPLRVVHRDMSPHNVFVTFGGRVKVLDFGIAKLANSQVETATGIIKGKLRYMPPEQLNGEPVDLRTDLFSVGVMLWEAATGERMWTGLSEVSVMKAIKAGSIPRVIDVFPDIAPELESIITRSLAPDAAQRYSSARDLKHALDEYLRASGPPITDEDVEEVLERLFGEEQEQTRALIEAQVARVSTLSANELLAISPLDLMHGTTPAGMTASRLNRFSSPVNKARGSWLVLGMLGLVVLAGAMVAWQGPWVAQTSELTLQAAPSSATATPGEAAHVDLHITAFPGSAELFLDGQKLHQNPFRASFALDAKSVHELRATAPAYESEFRSVIFDQTQDLVFSLEAQKPPTTKKRTPIAEATAAQPPPPKVLPAKSCDPPFTIDARGMKKFKPECLE